MPDNKNDTNSKQDFFFGDDAFSPLSASSAEVDEGQSADEQNISESGHTKIYRPKKSFLSNVFEWLDVVVASIVVVVIIFTFFFRIVAIDGDSMKNTLFDEERVIITNLFYEPQKGDIVVISRNTENSSLANSYDEPIIKRIIATAGDTVDIDFNSGTVYVNNEPLKEPYIREPTYNKGDVKFPLVVKENTVFVLGDNRNESLDSRSTSIGENGLVDVKYILGHAVLRIFPLNKFGGIE